MDTPALLWQGLASAVTLPHLVWAFAGAVLGTAVDVLPGIGPAMAVAMLLPVTFSLDPTSAFIMFAGIYSGAMYGGSTTSILINAPGETSSVVTSIDGHMMARDGKASAALATAAIGSFVAGTLGTIGLTVCAPAMASVALLFGPPEYFALAVVALATVVSLPGAAFSAGVLSLLVGLLLGVVGIDPLSGRARFSLGIPQLLNGVDPMILVIGLFAVGETFYQAWVHGRDAETAIALNRSTRMSADDWRRSWKPWLRGSLIGFPLGVLPIGGSVIPTVLSYALEKRLSARPEQFGRGAIEGVAGPEAANNAAAAGVLVPLLTLGLPSSPTAAVLLTAFQQYGLQPGPMLFTTRPDLVWTLIASLYVGNVMLLILNLPLAPFWARVMLVPRSLLFGGILLLASLGAYSLNRSVVDLALLFLVGAGGFAMRVLGVPLIPAVMGLILGPVAEQEMRRALAISQGDITIFAARPIAAALLVASLAILLAPTLWRRASRWLRPSS